MIPLAFRTSRRLTAALLCGALMFVAPVGAADVAPADLEAAVRALGFLDSLQRHSSIIVGVVYRTGDAESKALAQRTAAILASLKGPNGADIDATVLAAGEFGQGARHVDVAYIVPGASDPNHVLAEALRRQHVVSLSNDPGCLSAQCCVLMVRAGARTEILLDVARAHETGAAFSSVFMMMVKRI